MASGYIGKISAVVTANTSDLSKKLRGSIQDWNKFGSSLNSSLNRFSADATKSIEKIFTPIQQLERKLKAAVSSPLNIRTGEQANQIRRIASAAEQINAPLQAAAGGFQKLSTEVQAGFVPALGKAQRQAETLFSLIQAGKTPSETAFAAVQSRVERTTQALQRLTQAQQIVSRGFTGNELQFRSPAVLQALSQSSQATQSAAGLPASALQDGVVGDQVRQLRQYQDALIQAQARLESLELSPNVDSSRIDEQRKKVDNLVETVNRASAQLATGVARADGRLTILTDAEVDADNAKRSLVQLREERDRLQAGTGKLTILTGVEVEADNARRSLIRLREERDKLQSDFGQTANTEFFESAAVDRQRRELSRLREIVSNVSVDVRGPLSLAFQRYAAVATEALQDGERGLLSSRDRIEELRRRVIALAAASGQVGDIGAIGRSLGANADIGRKGVDRLSLALNQAAFAVDDFFSATGGIEFKLRAVQNNLTQLAFIVGGQTAIWGTLAFVIGTQAVIALTKFILETDKAKLRLEALNDALSSQKSGVEELADAYSRLADEIANAGSSESLRTDRTRRRALDELDESAEDVRRQVALQFSPDALRIRAELGQQENLLEETSDIQQRQEILSRIGQLQRELDETLARGVVAPTAEAVLGSVISAAERQVQQAEVRLRRAQLREDLGGDAPPGQDVQSIEAELELRRRRLADARGAAAPATATEQLAELRSSLQLAEEERRTIRELQAQGERIRTDEIDQTIADLTTQIARIEASLSPEVQAAARAAVESAFVVSDSLAAAGDIIRGSSVSGASAIQEELDSISETLSVATNALSQASTVEEAESIQRDIDALETLAQSAVQAANATNIFSETLSRVATDLANTVAGEAQSAADQARRDANAVVTDPLATADQRRVAQQRRIEAEFEANLANAAARQLEEDRVSAVQQFDRDAAAGNLGVAVQSLVDERRRLEEELNADGTPVERRQQIRARQRQIDAQLSAEFEASPAGRALRDRADALDRDSTRERRQLESAARGEDLIANSAEQAAQQLAQSLLDVREAFDLRRRAGVADQANLQAETEARLIEETRRQIAPAVFALVDQSANAVAQGPSRARLNASDITTQAGTDELNRLLRGDDSARDQNLIELRKQTQQLEEANRTLKNLGVAP